MLFIPIVLHRTQRPSRALFRTTRKINKSSVHDHMERRARLPGITLSRREEKNSVCLHYVKDQIYPRSLSARARQENGRETSSRQGRTAARAAVMQFYWLQAMRTSKQVSSPPRTLRYGTATLSTRRRVSHEVSSDGAQRGAEEIVSKSSLVLSIDHH